MTNEPSNKSTAILTLLKKLVVPEFRLGFERPCRDTDYEEFSIQSVNVIHELEQIIFEDDPCSFCTAECLLLYLVVLAQNHQRFPWNNDEIISTCNNLHTYLKEATQQTIPTILGDGIKHKKNEIRPLTMPLLQYLRPKLLHDSWKQHPAAVECFCWVLKNSKPNRLSDHIHRVLPTALLLVDDFDNSNRMSGVQCIQRILDDMTLAEMKFHGYGQLIYTALELILRERDANLASSVFGCILHLVVKLETDLSDISNNCVKWSRYDDVTEIILDNMESEQKLDIRSVYINNLPILIKALDQRVHRWTKRLLNILDSYVETAGSLQDYETAISALQALLILIKTAVDVKLWYQDKVLLIIMHIFYYIETSKPSTTATSRICNVSRMCLNELFCGQPSEDIHRDIENIRQHIIGDEMGTKILDSIQELTVR